MNGFARAGVGVAAVISTVLVAGCASSGGSAASKSGPSPAGSASKIIDVTMSDLAFSPSKLTVRKGDTITFRFRNKGAVVHEALIADAAAQREHAAAMKTAPAGKSMAHDASMPMADAAHSSMPTAADHSEGTPLVVVKPGKTGDVTMTFDKSTTLQIGCHQPGHYEAGMKATLTVS